MLHPDDVEPVAQSMEAALDCVPQGAVALLPAEEAERVAQSMQTAPEPVAQVLRPEEVEGVAQAKDTRSRLVEPGAQWVGKGGQHAAA